MLKLVGYYLGNFGNHLGYFFTLTSGHTVQVPSPPPLFFFLFDLLCLSLAQTKMLNSLSKSLMKQVWVLCCDSIDLGT